MLFELLVLVGIVWTVVAGWILASMCAAAHADYDTECALVSTMTLDPLLAATGLQTERRHATRRSWARPNRSGRRATSSGR